jgi:hypothetical protein
LISRASAQPGALVSANENTVNENMAGEHAEKRRFNIKIAPEKYNSTPK